MTNAASIVYPFDPTGVATSNLVSDEIHTVTEINSRPYRILIPDFAPFYLHNLSLSHVDDKGNVTPLTQMVDYAPTLPYHVASRSTGQFLYGAVQLNNDLVNGTVKITYQTIGDKWCADRDYVYNVLLESIYNERSVYWDQLTNVQDTFPPLPHDELAENFTGHTEVLKALADIATQILNKPNDLPAIFLNHIAQSNAHGVNATTVGLDQVANLRLATDQECLNRSPVKAYVTLDQLIRLGLIK